MNGRMGASDAARRALWAQAGAHRAIVLFDGVCHLCQGSVRFIADRDPAGYFAFAPLQSRLGASLLEAGGLGADGRESLVLIENGRVYTRSGGALRIARRLTGMWKLLALLLVVPAPIRDALYNWVARHRYEWFGRSDSCEIPSAAARARVLGDEQLRSPNPETGG